MCCMCVGKQCVRGVGGGDPIQITGPGAQEESPTLLHMVLSFSVVSVFVDLQINLFR